MKRRNFLKNITAGVAIPSLVNGFGVTAYANSPFSPLLNAITTDTDHVLVMVQLAGGNDGLNTLVPLDQYDRLQKGRADVIMPKNKLLSLTGVTKSAFHPALTGLRSLYDEGMVRVVQSVGYPEQSYSHFRSTDIWMSGANANEYVPSGWAGRYLNYEYPNFPADYPNPQVPHPLAIEIGYSQSLSLMGPQTGMGYVIADPEYFYNLLAGVQDPAPNTPAGAQLSYIRLVAQQSRAYAQSIVAASGKVTAQGAYPETELAVKLKIIARLIAGGLKTRLYVVTLDGFDTHDTQVDPADHTAGDHADLLKTLGDAIRAFTDDIRTLGVADRVTGMTFSEFGRRITANASGGTDHGEAAPMFLFGKAVSGGILGNNPEIPANPTEEDNLPLQFDFRSVYATIMRDWLCVPEPDVSAVMLHKHPYLDLFRSGVACISTAVRDANRAAGTALLRVSPNPFSDQVRLEYETKGNQCIVQVLDVHGKVLATPVRSLQPAGIYSEWWDATALPAGTYFFRLLNGLQQQTKMGVKE